MDPWLKGSTFRVALPVIGVSKDGDIFQCRAAPAETQDRELRLTAHSVPKRTRALGTPGHGC
jgi:hypothetical protein